MFPSRRITMSGGSSFQNSKSLAFDGTNDYVSVGSTFQSTFRGDHSYSMWIKPTDGQRSGTTNMLFGTKDSSEDYIYGAILASGKMRYFFKANNDNDQLDTDTAVFTDGPQEWTHVAITAQKSTSLGFKLYVNGILHKEQNSSATTSGNWEAYTSATNFHIGAYNNEGTAALPYEGGMSDFALYNRVLTANEVRTIYNNKEAFNHKDWNGTKNLVSWFRLGDGTLDRWGSNPDASFNSFLITDEVSPTIGTDVITNGTFASDSGWTKGGGWSISGGTASRAAGESSNSAIEHAGDAITADRTYKYSFDFNIASGNCSAYLGGTTLDSSFTGSGTNFGYVTAIGGGEFTLYGLSSAEVTSIDNVKAWLIGGAAGTTVNMDGADIVGDTP